VRRFVFVMGIDEVTGIFLASYRTSPRPPLIQHRGNGVGWNGRSDYGMRPHRPLWDGWGAQISKEQNRTTVLILGTRAPTTMSPGRYPRRESGRPSELEGGGGTILAKQEERKIPASLGPRPGGTVGRTQWRNSSGGKLSRPAARCGGRKEIVPEERPHIKPTSWRHPCQLHGGPAGARRAAE